MKSPSLYSQPLLSLLLLVYTDCSLVVATEFDELLDFTPQESGSGCPGTSLLQASMRRGILHSSAEQDQNFAKQAPGPAQEYAYYAKLFAECSVLVVGFIVLMGCMRSNRQGFFHHQSDDVAAIVGQHKPKDDEGTDAGDWTSTVEFGQSLNLDQLLEGSLGASSPDPLLRKDPFAPGVIPQYIESHYSSWRLLAHLLLHLGEFWAALIYMYVSLLDDEDESKMKCEAYPMDAKHAFFVVHACHYTRACLHGFPVIAANMVLVLMVRTLVQQRLYYSVLRFGYLIVFQGIPILYTVWPLAIAASMGQGALHFVLKAYYMPDNQTTIMALMVIRKFALPGIIFFMILFALADVERTLVPLNHIVEQEANEDQHCSPWLKKLRMINERVLAFDVRHRDVFADTVAEVGKVPNLNDIIRNVLANQNAARDRWHVRMHRHWGLFRSLWPAALLIDVRLDRDERFTRSWLIICAILVIGGTFTSLLSVHLLVNHTKHVEWYQFFVGIKSLLSKGYAANSGHVLVTAVVLWHVMVIAVLMYLTIYNMFYFSFSRAEIQMATNEKFHILSPVTMATNQNTATSSISI